MVIGKIKFPRKIVIIRKKVWSKKFVNFKDFKHRIQWVVHEKSIFPEIEINQLQCFFLLLCRNVIGFKWNASDAFDMS